MEYRIFRILDLISIKDENIFEISVIVLSFYDSAMLMWNIKMIMYCKKFWNSKYN